MRQRFYYALIVVFALSLCPAAWAGHFVMNDLLLDELNDFNRSSLSTWGMGLAFDTVVDSSDVDALSFQQDFKKAWGSNISPRLVTSLSSSQV